MMTLPYQAKALNFNLIGLVDRVQNTGDIVLAYDILHFLYSNFTEIDPEYYCEFQLMELPEYEHNQVAIELPEPAILDYQAPIEVLVELLGHLASNVPYDEDLVTQLDAFHKTQAKARKHAVVCIGEEFSDLIDNYIEERVGEIEYVDEERRPLNAEIMTDEERKLFNPLRVALKDFELIQVSTTMPTVFIQQLITFADQAFFSFIQDGDSAKIPLKLVRTFPHLFKHPKLKVLALGDVEHAGETMNVFTEIALDQYGIPRDEQVFYGYDGLAVVVGRIASNFEPLAD